ncbi:MAG TPA: serine/threonine-protein kinase [Anaerolineae bacterium]|nr:serine/threonine-protein kinase [Anaerolineae bacterium]HOQ97671.1 serine/threonine-protein kinase [Anaerolineae bacterium]HPL26603.1 serine/threonine-protein kinase [Anaerolineae bacterium]
MTRAIAILIVLVALGYLYWWWRRYAPARRARRLAATAMQQGDWPQALIEQLLEYARLLDAASPAMAAVCIGLAKRGVADPRARALYERLLAVQRVTPENAVVARRLAQFIAPEPVAEPRAAEAGNAAALLDQVIQLGLANDEDVLRRATLARLWVDVAEPALAACLAAWRLLRGTPQAEPLARFLYDCYAARDDVAGPAAAGDGAAAQDSLSGPAQVFCTVADAPPASLVTRRRAIAATFACGASAACVEQCQRARDDFGAPALDDDIWRLWGQAIVGLAARDWPAFEQGASCHLPAGASWPRLQEALDHACGLEPDDMRLLRAQVWAYLLAQTPIARALPVYERALAKRLPIVPALERLAEHAHEMAAWGDLERACLALLPLQAGEPATRTRHWLAEAWLEGGLTPDVAILEAVFDSDPDYAALNGRLAGHYLEQPSLAPHELARIERLLESPLPPAFAAARAQALREKYALAWLDTDVAPSAAFTAHLNRYLETGGAHERLMAWAIDAGVGSRERRQAVLESLVRRRPAEQRHCLELAESYARSGASEEQVRLLAEAAEDGWRLRPSFDDDDCRLAAFIGERRPLPLWVRRKLLQALLLNRPSGWQELASRCLAGMLEQGEAGSELLQLVTARLYRSGQRDPLHVWALEVLSGQRDEPVADGVRLLALYDAGVARPGEAAGDAQRKGQALAEALAGRCRRAGAELRAALFPPLLTRLLGRDVTTLASWEIELFIFGTQGDLATGTAASLRFAAQLADALAAREDARAVALQRWAYEHGERATSSAARLFAMADRFQAAEGGDPFWFDVARLAQGEAEVAAAACSFLVAELLRRDRWGDAEVEVALGLLTPPYRAQLAPAFVQRVAPGRERRRDRALLELLDETPALGAGRAELLLSLAERRAARHDHDGALAACFLVEESVGGSEELTGRILGLLLNSPSRAQHAGRLAGYLERYPNSFDLLAQMAALAHDASRPLSFELALEIVDRWGDLAARQDSAQTAYAHDPSFVVTVKCEVYELYREQMTPQNEQALLRSIAKHSRQALGGEARQHIERVSEAVLASSGHGYEVRQVVAELLYGLGNLAAATWHLEQLAEVAGYHQMAVEALGRIARQLESPRRELPALLAAYRCIADDAYHRGDLDAAEAVAQKAKAILLDEGAFESLTEEGRKRLAAERDPILRLHQIILESRRESAALSLAQTRDLADVCRLLRLWDKAGRLYSELALALQRSGNRNGALECAEAAFYCYYKAGKEWWDPAGKYLLRILWGFETPPRIEVADKFDARELRLMESVAVLYHSLCVVEDLLPVQRSRYRRDALMLYEHLPLGYVHEHDYVRRLMYDLRQAEPSIEEPFDLVPHIREHGRAERWTGRRYERLELLGSGAFADVFKVFDTQEGVPRAMKLITPATGRDPKALQQFQSEGRWLRELDHPNIVKCYDVGVEEDRQFIIMDYVEGQTLDDLITRRRREIPLETRLRIFLCVCSAAEYLHNQGILHRDLHPGNVLVGGADLETVRLTDFGLATMMDREGVGKSSRINGRENYIPPEVIARRKETVASEVYSLGAMLCFVLSGWPHPDAALRRELGSPEYLGLGEVIERALSNDPAARYQRVTELIHDICRRAGLRYDYGAILMKVTPLRFNHMFEIVDKVGRGEAGTVYRAHDLRTPGAPDVAIKEISSDRVRGSLERRAEHFYRVRDLTHPNLVQLQAFFCVDGKLYVVMEWVEGRSLADMMEANEAQGRRFLPADSLHLVGDVTRALAFVHQQGIVHGCVVPTNVLVEKNGTEHARLSDFAASVLFEGDQWHKSALIRQYNYYLAPETARNEAVTPASDVYSLGWLLCQVVTGQRGQLSPAEIYAALEELGRWSEAQKEGLVAIIEGSTALDPARRAYADGAALLAALDGIAVRP